MYNQPVELSTIVDLTISCKNLTNKDLLSKSDPACIIKLRDNRTGKFRVLGFTERIKDNLNPQFTRTIPVEYRFEEQQLLRFELYDIDSKNFNGKIGKGDDPLGSATVQLAQICGAKGQVLKKDLLVQKGRKKGSIIIRADDRSSTVDEDIIMAFSAKNLKKMDLFGKSDPYFILKKRVQGSWTRVFKSETIMKNLNPHWTECSLHLSKLVSQTKDEKFRFECFDYDKGSDDDMIGACEMSVNELLSGRSFQIFVKGKKKSRGEVSCRCRVKRNWKFYDYLKGGMELSLTVAIDFTGSNGNPRTPGTLHYHAPNVMNDYEQAIRSIGEILCNYDSDSLFPVYGFGAKLPGGKVSHCFACTGNPNQPQCLGVEGIIMAYKQCLSTISLYGPTHFEKIIGVAAKHAKQERTSQDVQKYHILLILTDGVINDLQKTINEIVKASKINLSIVIVGVGTANFKDMDKLDGDNVKLRDSKGKKSARDIVQFVPFNSVKKKGYMELAKQTLAEIPKQVTQFFSKKGIVPNQRPVVNFYQQQQQIQPQMQMQMQQQQVPQQQPQQQQMMMNQQQVPQQQMMMQNPNQQMNNMSNMNNPQMMQNPNMMYNNNMNMNNQQQMMNPNQQMMQNPNMMQQQQQWGQNQNNMMQMNQMNQMNQQQQQQRPGNNQQNQNQNYQYNI